MAVVIVTAARVMPPATMVVAAMVITVARSVITIAVIRRARRVIDNRSRVVIRGRWIGRRVVDRRRCPITATPAIADTDADPRHGNADAHAHVRVRERTGHDPQRGCQYGSHQARAANKSTNGHGVPPNPKRTVACSRSGTESTLKWLSHFESQLTRRTLTIVISRAARCSLNRVGWR